MTQGAILYRNALLRAAHVCCVMEHVTRWASRDVPFSMRDSQFTIHDAQRHTGLCMTLM
jgi:hypothetical protein